MDFFDTNRDGFKAMRMLAETDFNEICLNYTTINKYSA